MSKRKLDYSTLNDLFDAKGVYQKNGANLDKFYDKLKEENKVLENQFVKELLDDSNTSIKMVWAEDDKHAIGKNGTLPWDIPSDLKHFKEETIGSTMIMGRNTWNSIGWPLPGRKTVILTSQHDFETSFDNVIVLHDLDELKSFMIECAGSGDKITIVGGAQIYKELMDFANELSITRVAGDFSGDTFVDQVDETKFALVDQQDSVDGDYRLSFLRYMRK